MTNLHLSIMLCFNKSLIVPDHTWQTIWFGLIFGDEIEEYLHYVTSPYNLAIVFYGNPA